MDAEDLGKHVEQMIDARAARLEHEIEQCLCYGREREAVLPALGECAPRAHELAAIFLRRLPQIRGLLIRDVQAAFDGEPPALKLGEINLAPPGGPARSGYAVAHALYDLGAASMAALI